jgi:hypothetical protein
VTLPDGRYNKTIANQEEKRIFEAAETNFGTISYGIVLITHEYKFIVTKYDELPEL